MSDLTPEDLALYAVEKAREYGLPEPEPWRLDLLREGVERHPGMAPFVKAGIDREVAERGRKA